MLINLKRMPAFFGIPYRKFVNGYALVVILSAENHTSKCNVET